MANPNSAFLPPPPDLTKFIVKRGDQYTGAGNFGDVYNCRLESKELIAQVAVKAFRFKLQVDNNMARRELGIWRRLKHPNIVPFLGIATGFGMFGSQSLVSLWMPNGTLQSFLEEYENLGVDHRLRLLLDIANGLHYLHSFTLSTTTTSFSSPIVHGDLNPANVVLDDDYTARLVDFGYASMMGEIPEALTYLRRSTNNLGALRWVAPEHVRSSTPDICRTTQGDIYSFGCIALQVLSGKQPWSELGEVAAVILQLSWGCMPARPKSQPIDERHWQLIERCLSPIPNRPAADIILSSIEQFLESCPRSQPLRDVIASWSNQPHSQLPDPSHPSSFSSLKPSGDKESNGVARPNCHDQHVSE